SERPETDGSVDFYGALFRYELPASLGVFVDLRLGFTRTNVTQSGTDASTDTAFGWGIGIGSKMGLTPIFEIRPIVGFRLLPEKGSGSNARTFFDIGLQLVLTFSPTP